MNVISLKDYAKQHNISYEAVRKQVARFKEELTGHIIIDGRQQLLDEDAVAFLDARREKNPIAIIQQDKDDRIEDLKNKNDALLLKIADIQDKLIAVQNEKMKLLDERLAIAEKFAKVELIEAGKEEAEKKVEELSVTLAEAKNSAEQAEAARQQAVETLEQIRKEAKFRKDEAENAEQDAARAKFEAEKLAAELAELEQMTPRQFQKMKCKKKAIQKKLEKEERKTNHAKKRKN